MANILQEYTVGESFNTYTKTELSTSDWTWNYRTLIGLIDKDGKKYDLGSPITFNEQEAALSGVWELDKQKLTTISASSDSSGSISVLVHEINMELPLANTENPYINVQTFVLNPGESVSLSAYSQEHHGILSIDLIASDDTIFKAVTGSIYGRYTDIDSKKNWLHSQYGTGVWNNTASETYIHIYPLNYMVDSMYGISNKTIVFEFTQTGVLTYYPNTNTLNLNHSIFN